MTSSIYDHPTPTYFLNDGEPWRPWNAWHPVITDDEGMIWAWPWKRVAMWRRFAPSFCHIYAFADAATYHEPLAFYSIKQPEDGDDVVER